MKKQRLIFVWVLVFLVALSTTISVAAQGQTGIEISDAWARPTVSESGMGEGEEDAMNMSAGMTSAVYMAIANTSDMPLTLLTAETSIAETVEIHETIIGDNDVMQMRPVESAIQIAAGDSAALAPGGFHIMLIEPVPLAPGTAFAMTMIFQAGNDIVEVVVGVPVQEEPPIPSEIVITQAWARPTAAEMMDDDMDMMSTEEAMMDMGGTSAAYMFIENTSDTDVTLVGGATDAAGIVEIHETSMDDNDVMQMRPLVDGLTIPSGESVELRPGGFHIMFLDLQDPFVSGSALYLELAFDNGETLRLGVPIEDRFGMPMDMDG